MAYLKFYEKERKEFPEEYKIYIPTQRKAQILVNKLTRHYKMKFIKILFTKRKKDTGKMLRDSRVMLLHKSVFSIGLITHEVAHKMLMDQTGGKGHTKKLMTRIRRLNRYCKKMNYWGLTVTGITDNIFIMKRKKLRPSCFNIVGYNLDTKYCNDIECEFKKECNK